MTPAEAFGVLRVTLPDIVEGVIHDGIGLPATHAEALSLVDQLRHAATLDQAIAIDTKLSELAETDPPFQEAIERRTQGLRDKADAESPAGQIKQGARAVADAAQKAAGLASNLGTIALVGLGLWALVEVGKLGRTIKRGGAIS